MRALCIPFVMGLLLACAQAQVSAPASEPTVPRPPSAAIPATTPPVGNLLLRVDQAAGNLRADLAHLRIDKWKINGSGKQQAQENAQSLDRNVQLALPGMLQQVQATPDSLAAQFKLYRNVNALYDVLAGLAESAGAFGPKEDFDALQNDAATFDELRRDLADNLQTLTAAKDQEITRLATQLQARAEAAPAEPPKKIVIDDTETQKPAAKTTKKKAAPKKKEPPQQQPPH